MNLNDLSNIDSKKIKAILHIAKTNYDKDAAIFTLVLCLIIGFGIKQFIIPTAASMQGNLKKFTAKNKELHQFIEREKFIASPKSKQTRKNLHIDIYRAPFRGMDAESASADFVEEIIKIIKRSGNNRINNINFSSAQIKDDKNKVAKGYALLTLNLSINGPYNAVQKMLNEIYLMKYLVAIKNIESSPSNNYDIVNTNLTLDIYIKLNVPEIMNQEE